MIRRDYILRMIEEFARALARIKSLRQKGQTAEAEALLDEQFQHLLKTPAFQLLERSDTELLALLIESDSSVGVREKTVILTTLLSEAGDLAAERGDSAQARQYHLKALDLLLNVLRTGEIYEFAQFAPTVERLHAALAGTPVPLLTQGMLMQHFERTGEFAKAEDAFFCLLDAAEHKSDVVVFGLSFYERLLRHPDESLAAGNLPRSEVLEGLDNLRRRLNAAP